MCSVGHKLNQISCKPPEAHLLHICIFVLFLMVWTETSVTNMAAANASSDLGRLTVSPAILLHCSMTLDRILACKKKKILFSLNCSWLHSMLKSGVPHYHFLGPSFLRIQSCSFFLKTLEGPSLFIWETLQLV